MPMSTKNFNFKISFSILKIKNGGLKFRATDEHMSIIDYAN